MSIFDHHIYEYRKGLRGLVLHTVSEESAEALKMRLEKHAIDYVVYELTKGKCNIFFGDPMCLKVLQQFGSKKLNDLSVEEDFILGIMLGYSHQQQYQRYLMRKQRGNGERSCLEIFCKELQRI